MKNNSSVICIGELLIDFFCTDVDIDLVEGQNFEKQAGGAPANVCAAIVKLGGSALFSGKVGNDPFGHFLKNTLEAVNVDTSMLVLDDEHPTTLAFVSLKANGERDFIFNRGADAFLMENDLDKDRIMESSILHFGSATALLADPFQSTYVNLIQAAREEGKFISFDPNYRIDLWKGRIDDFIKLSQKGIAIADFVKVSDEELMIISGMNDREDGIAMLHELGAKVVAVTLGKEGTMVSNRQRIEIVPSVKVDSIDSTGAGDAFVGATLYQLSIDEEPKRLLENFEQLKNIISFSNKVGAIVCTKVGAISALPTQEEVHQF
ncbi:carbohydrate kinase family protein [Neobacillus drentensis]|uniref:carbohydrate kinase family protein n=1 Tax=Neobacillus drentensis TaxID=220684 RepID=UPI00285AE130|nr:carbohydrate kinase [Neobacillus drentensis]MDR7238198.1 fructokinase [Neobacillus drentensis]